MADQAAAMKSQMRTKDDQISALTAQVAMLTSLLKHRRRQLDVYRQCMQQVGKTIEEEEAKGKRMDTPPQGTLADLADCMDGTQLDQSTAAIIARE